MDGDGGSGGRPASELPVVNTHVHLPPNFSAFASVEDAVETAAAQGARVLGSSNFFDHRVYRRFAGVAEAAGIVPLFGLECISVLDDLDVAGVRVNDPANPGRMYICGKAVDPFAEPTPLAQQLLAAIRASGEDRMRAMIPRLRDRFVEAGLDTRLTYDGIAAVVAEPAGVPADWVVLQERHVAMAFQRALFEAATQRRATILARAFGGDAAPECVEVDETVAVQEQIRARLMKAGRPAFVPESPVSFDDAYRLVLEMDGIPCYPTLADGADPVCPWEDPPGELATRLRDRGIACAELIPNRNSRDAVDAYVRAFRGAGMIVLAGTEHNTQNRIPIEPRCSDGERPSDMAREAFWEGTCVVAAHQFLRANGRPGYVDRAGRPVAGERDAEARIRELREIGAERIHASVAAR